MYFKFKLKTQVIIMNCLGNAEFKMCSVTDNDFEDKDESSLLINIKSYISPTTSQQTLTNNPSSIIKYNIS